MKQHPWAGSQVSSISQACDRLCDTECASVPPIESIGHRIDLVGFEGCGCRSGWLTFQINASAHGALSSFMHSRHIPLHSAVLRPDI